LLKDFKTCQIGKKIMKKIISYFKVATATLILVGSVFLPAIGFSASPGDVIINEFSSASTPEWVELRNTTSSAVDLTGWKLTELTDPQGTPAEADLLSLSGSISCLWNFSFQC